MILDSILKFFFGKMFKLIVGWLFLILLIAFILMEIILAFLFKDVKYADLPEQLKWLMVWKLWV